MYDSPFPNLLVADARGKVFDIPELLMAGMSGACPVLPKNADLIPLPFGSDIFMLPGRIPVGFDPVSDEFVLLPEYGGEPVFPVAAFMAPAHMQYLLPAFREPETGAPAPLPMYGYTAVGWSGEGTGDPGGGKALAAGIRIDADIRQDLQYVDVHKIEKEAPEVLARYPGNRLVEHLVNNCALCYGCPAARNFVLGRWECPVPTSMACNAGCIGCISYQPKESGFKAAQGRIAFIPSVDEIVDFAVPHLEKAPRPVISFGQGCEGEPLLFADLIAESIRAIRKQTDKGIININTNGSLPEKVLKLCDAGLDSIRISLNSAVPDLYIRYYRPRNYTFEEVVSSISGAAGKGIWTSLNYFIFPGVTDRPAEIEALKKLIVETGLHMIQTRNTNIDPLLYWRSLGFQIEDELPEENNAPAIGLRAWLSDIRKTFPGVKLGYFNPSAETMSPG